MCLTNAVGVDEEEQRRQAWLRLYREQQARALRFGPRPEKARDKRRKLEPFEYGAIALTPPEEVEAYLQSFQPVFGRRDTLRQAELYLLGLLSDLGRKNGETIEAAVPGATQQGVWDFLVRSPWSAAELDRARVLYALQRTTGSAVEPLDVVIDEVSWVKKGTRSVGVARQYLGCRGKVDKGQVAVTLHGYADACDLPLTGEMYLNEHWIADQDRRTAAKIPEERLFLTKPEMALQLLRTVRTWGLQLGRVHGDAGYGDLDTLLALRAEHLECCLGQRGNAQVRLPGEDWIPAVPPPPYRGRGRPPQGQPARPALHTLDEVRESAPASLWRSVAYRQGVDGELLSREFLALRAHLATAGAESEELWLLLERPSTSNPDDDPKQYVITGPADMSLDELAQLAHRRPVIERNSYENAKQDAGLSDYQGRSWIGFHHHLAMVWLALTWLMLHRRPLPPPQAPREPVMPTPSESTPPRPPASLSFSAASVPITLAWPAATALPLPHQLWESVQEVHRRLVEWFHGMHFRELLFVGTKPPLPVLGALPAGP